MGVATDFEFFISRCEREFTATEIILTAADQFHAEGVSIAGDHSEYLYESIGEPEFLRA